MPTSIILGTGAYAPLRVLTNAELEKMVATNGDWIVSRTGIRERRIAAEEQATSDLAAAAARQALDSAGVAPEEVDMIIVATVTGDTPTPACAAHVQALLGAKNACAFDVGAACAGSLYGLTIGGGVNNLGTLFKYALAPNAVTPDQDRRLGIWPNPSNGQFTVATPAASGWVRVVDACGVPVWQTDVRGARVTLDLRALPKGVYDLEVWDGAALRCGKVVLE